MVEGGSGFLALFLQLVDDLWDEEGKQEKSHGEEDLE